MRHPYGCTNGRHPPSPPSVVQGVLEARAFHRWNGAGSRAEGVAHRGPSGSPGLRSRASRALGRGSFPRGELSTVTRAGLLSAWTFFRPSPRTSPRLRPPLLSTRVRARGARVRASGTWVRPHGSRRASAGARVHAAGPLRAHGEATRSAFVLADIGRRRAPPRLSASEPCESTAPRTSVCRPPQSSQQPPSCTGSCHLLYASIAPQPSH